MLGQQGVACQLSQYMGARESPEDCRRPWSAKYMVATGGGCVAGASAARMAPTSSLLHEVVLVPRHALRIEWLPIQRFSSLQAWGLGNSSGHGIGGTQPSSFYPSLSGECIPQPKASRGRRVPCRQSPRSHLQGIEWYDGHRVVLGGWSAIHHWVTRKEDAGRGQQVCTSLHIPRGRFGPLALVLIHGIH